MIIFYNKKNKRFIGTLDAPTNTAGIKIIPGGVKPQDVVETEVNPKLLDQIIELRRKSPDHVTVKLSKNDKVIGFSQEKTNASYSKLEHEHKIKEQKIKDNLEKVKDKNLPTKERLDALSELIELKSPVLENVL